MTKEEVDHDTSMITDMISLFGVKALALIDSGATHSFISESFVWTLGITSDKTDIQFDILLPLGQELQTSQIVRACVIQVSDHLLYADLIVLRLSDFDVILGIDWLSKYNAVIDCQRKVVNFAPTGEQPFILESTGTFPILPIISSMKARKLFQKRCQGFLALVMDVNDKFDLKLENIDVVCEFSEAFHDDVTWLPPDREIEFVIDVIPGTNPISRAPYRMAPTEMKELKKQLQDLLNKGFIYPSFSPWGAPVLFVKKKDGSLRL